MKKKDKIPKNTASSTEQITHKEPQDKTGSTSETFYDLKEVIPISYEGHEIGTIDFAFTQSDGISSILKTLSLPAPEDWSRTAYDLALWGILAYMKEHLQEDIQLGLRRFFQARKGLDYRFTVYMYYYPGAYERKDTQVAPDTIISEKTLKPAPYLLNEEEIFGEIRSVGPAVLRQGPIQDALAAWLGNRDVASEMMNKLKDALLTYSLGSLDKPLKVGRPRSKVLQYSSEDWIKPMYKEISAVLKIAKRRAVVYKKDLAGDRLTDKDRASLLEIKERIEEAVYSGEETTVTSEGGKSVTSAGHIKPDRLKPKEAAKRRLRAKLLRSKEALLEGSRLYSFISVAYGEYLSHLEKQYSDSASPAAETQLEDRIDRLGFLRQTYRFLENPVSAALRSNRELEDEFKKLNFQPNKLAKDVVAELLEMSPETLVKHLY